jgi:hypothetical protein
MSDLAISDLASTDLDKSRRRRAAGAAIPTAQNQTPQTSNFPRKPTNSPESAVDATDCAPPPPAPRTPASSPRTPASSPTNPTAPSHPKQESVNVAFYRIYWVERHVH